MSISFEQLDQNVRYLNKMAVAYRSPQESGSAGIGITVALFYHMNAYVVSVEKFRDDAGYGENLSRTEQTFEALQTAIDEIAKHGFNIEQLEIR